MAAVGSQTTAAAEPQESRVVGDNPRIPSRAPAVVAKPAENVASLDVAVVRVDSIGNLYTKT
jgi:hypothetical protein